MKSDQQCTGLKINEFAFEKVQIGTSGIKVREVTKKVKLKDREWEDEDLVREAMVKL